MSVAIQRIEEKLKKAEERLDLVRCAYEDFQEYVDSLLQDQGPLRREVARLRDTLKVLEENSK